MIRRCVWGALALSGCGVVGPAAQGDLDAARRVWQDQAVANYEYTFRWECFCAYTQLVRIVVRDGVVTGVSEIESGDPPPAFVEDFPTVDELFDLIQDAIDRDAHEIVATFHESRGFPVTVRIDYNEFTADEEQGFTISTLVALEADS